MARNLLFVELSAAAGGMMLAASSIMPLHAQNSAIEDVKSKIMAAKMVQQTFASGLAHCHELDGTNFYFAQRDRVLNLTDYRRSINNLALSRSFNPETNKPWTQQDADARWLKAQQQATQDKANCDFVASLPALQEKLRSLQQASVKADVPAAGKADKK